MTQLSHDQRLDIVQQYLVATENGNDSEAKNIIQQIPLDPPLARAFKRALGADYLKQSGFDLSEAEAAYGHDWLDQ